MITAESYSGKTIYFSNISLANNSATAKFDAFGFKKGSITMSWSGADAVDGKAFVEASMDNVIWFTLGGVDGERIIDSPNGKEAWELTSINFPFIRFSVNAGSNTTGTANVEMWMS